jgi:CMP-N-acetylneuraminic acid synthetase
MAGKPTIDGSAVGLIPARGGSKSIPLKNLTPLAGRPLISYVIAAGQAAESLNRVWCSTDDDRIADVCRQAGVEVFDRPAELAQDDSAVADVLRDVLNTIATREGAVPEMIALLQPTSPFLLAEHIDRCVGALRERPDADSAQTIVPVDHNSHAFNQRVIEGGVVRFRFVEERRAAYNKQRKPRHYLFGNVVATRSASLMAGKDCFGDVSIPVEIPRHYGCDVDTPEDLAYAEYLIHTNKVRLTIAGARPKI